MAGKLWSKWRGTGLLIHGKFAVFIPNRGAEARNNRCSTAVGFSWAYNRVEGLYQSDIQPHELLAGLIVWLGPAFHATELSSPDLRGVVQIMKYCFTVLRAVVYLHTR